MLLLGPNGTGQRTRLAMSITRADGTVKRWGHGERDAADIPADLTFSTSIPGGFKDLSCSLLRRIDLDYTDQTLFNTVRVYGPGNRTVWEGRMAQFPRSHGTGTQITPGAVGHAAHLRDDPSFREVFVDMAMTGWTPPPLSRRRLIASSGWTQDGVPVSVGPRAPGGIVWTPQNQALPAEDRSEIHYDIGTGIKIAHLVYQGRRTGAFTNFEAPQITVSGVEDFATSTFDSMTLDGTINTATAFTDGRYGMLRLRTTAATTPGVGWEQSLNLLTVYGDHGLTIRSITGTSGGFYGHDVIAYILDQAAPGLTYTMGGSVENTNTFVIPHLTFPDPVTAEDAISQANAFFLYEWGVYDSREFFWRAPDPDRLTWQARLSDGAQIDLEGDDAANVFNGVFVTYQDGTGKKMTVGPPGGNFDNTDSALQDTSPTNPVNANGITRRWARLDVSFPTTLAGATAIGAVYLREKSLPQRRGTLTLNNTVTHPLEGDVPVWRVRAGDYIKIADHPANVPRRIIETRYTHGTGELSASLDNTPSKLDAILERIGVNLVGVY